MKRREFITILTGTAAWPLATRAQQPAMPVIGFLNSRAPSENPAILAAFRRGFEEAGYVEGRNVAVEYRWAGGQYDRLPALAADLVGRQVAAIVANGPAVQTAKSATSTLPIVFVVGFDPLAFGLVDSLSRPGGNLTGVSVLDVEIGAKRLELLHELVPTATIIALLVNPTTPAAETVTREAQAAARGLGLQLHVLHASSDRDFDAVFATVAQLRAGALVIGADPFFTSHSEEPACAGTGKKSPAGAATYFATPSPGSVAFFTIAEYRSWAKYPPTSPSKAVAKPTASTPKAKRLQEIWVAETKKDALAAFDAFVES